MASNDLTAHIPDIVTETFGDVLRVRACGICIAAEKVLLVGHRVLPGSQLYWAPPGGGIVFGESSREAVEREILEETGMSCVVGRYMFLKEFLRPPLHAIEIYFEVQAMNPDSLFTGQDPELPGDRQLISEARFMSLDEISLLPNHCIDPVFHYITSLEYLRDERNWSIIQKKLI